MPEDDKPEVANDEKHTVRSGNHFLWVFFAHQIVVFNEKFKTFKIRFDKRKFPPFIWLFVFS